MKHFLTRRTLIPAIAAIGLAACGGADEPDADADLAYDEDASEYDYEDDSLGDDEELGSLSVDVAGDVRETQGYCSLAITRMEAEAVATVAANLTVQGNDDQSDFGELNIAWGTDPENGTVPMGINYEPPVPDDSEEYDLGWVYDAENPGTASFALSVDGENFDVVGGDPRGADDARGAPHLWQSTLVVSANLVNPRDDGQANRGEGKFKYDGLCTVSVRVLTD